MYEIVCDRQALHLHDLNTHRVRAWNCPGPMNIYVCVCICFFFVVYLEIFRLDIVCCLCHWKDHHKPVYFAAFHSQIKCKQTILRHHTWYTRYLTQIIWYKTGLNSIFSMRFWFSISLFLFHVSLFLFLCRQRFMHVFCARNFVNAILKGIWSVDRFILCTDKHKMSWHIFMVRSNSTNGMFYR